MWSNKVSSARGITLYKNGTEYWSIGAKYSDDQKLLNGLNSSRHLYELANLLLCDEKTSIEEGKVIVDMVRQASYDLVLSLKED
jgi:hypothetical protein